MEVIALPGSATLVNQTLEDLNHILSLSKPGEHHQLNFSDEVQYNFYLNGIRDSGMTPERYPQFFKNLEECRRHHLKNGGPAPLADPPTNGEEPVDVNMITGVYFSGNKTNVSTGNNEGPGTATALSSVAGGTIFTKQRLQIIDTITGKVWEDVNPPAVYGGGKYEEIKAVGNPPNWQNIQVVYTYSYQDMAGNMPVFNNVNLLPNGEAEGIPTVTAPVRKPEHEKNNYITMGIGRNQQYFIRDCDYNWNEPINDVRIVRLPLVGSQKFKSRIVSPITENDITCYLLVLNGGGGYHPISPKSDLVAGIKISPSDPTVLEWNFTYDYEVTKDKSIQFGEATFPVDSLTVLTFMVRVKTENSKGETVYTCIWGSPTPPWDNSGDIPGFYKIRPFKYTWHCVAEDTLVKLPGGKTKRIDQLAGGDTLMSNAEGDVLMVMNNIFSDKIGEIFSIRDEFGHSLLSTEYHAVMTAAGIKLAKKLDMGDVLITEKGNAKIVSIQRIPFQGRVWNIGLCPVSEDLNEIDNDGHTFFANGILVGDIDMSIAHQQYHNSKIETVLAKIPKEWHRDAINAYQDRIAMEG